MKEINKLSMVYLLCDCNNFFVSCEKIFRPDLKNRPVAVLSNNDGIVVSRSNETKNLGIAMGSPVFKIQDKINRYKIETFSSNFSLYLNISNRVMLCLESFCQDIEVYSVDEAFLCYRNITEAEAIKTAKKIRACVLKQIGITVGIGVATSKTLAKLANHYAKINSYTGGIFSALSDDKRQKILIESPLKEIWGIGPSSEEKLTNEGFKTAYSLSKADPEVMRKKYNINLARTINELNGIDCIESIVDSDCQNQIMWSRSFKNRLTKIDDIYEAVANYVSCACEKLRSLELYAKKMALFIRTSYFGNAKKYSNKIAISLEYPCSDTRVFISAAKILLDRIFVDGYEYAKAGIILYEFTDSRTFQSDLFNKAPNQSELNKNNNLMNAVDKINKDNKDTIYLGAVHSLTKVENKKKDKINKDHFSKRYTASFDELPEVF